MEEVEGFCLVETQVKEDFYILIEVCSVQVVLISKMEEEEDFVLVNRMAAHANPNEDEQCRVDVTSYVKICNTLR